MHTPIWKLANPLVLRSLTVTPTCQYVLKKFMLINVVCASIHDANAPHAAAASEPCNISIQAGAHLLPLAGAIYA